MKDAVEDYPQNIPGSTLKVPHHGSKHNLTTEVINMLKPSSAVISAKGSKSTQIGLLCISLVNTVMYIPPQKVEH